MMTAGVVVAGAAGGYFAHTMVGVSVNKSKSEPSILITELGMADLASLRMPLDEYVDGSNSITFVHAAKARAILTNRCLTRFGVNTISTADMKPLYPGNTRAWGIYNEKEAAQFGYHIPGQRLIDQTAAPDAPPTSVMFGQPAVASFNGKPVPQGGCTSEADRALNVAMPTDVDIDLGADLATTAQRESEQDSRVRAAVTTWRRCMLESGYRYNHPWEANDDPAFATPTPSQREKAVAGADVRCKKRANYINTRAAVEKAYQERVIEQNATELAEHKHALDTRETIAIQVISARKYG